MGKRQARLTLTLHGAYDFLVLVILPLSSGEMRAQIMTGHPRLTFCPQLYGTAECNSSSRTTR